MTCLTERMRLSTPCHWPNTPMKPTSSLPEGNRLQAAEAWTCGPNLEGSTPLGLTRILAGSIPAETRFCLSVSETTAMRRAPRKLSLSHSAGIIAESSADQFLAIQAEELLCSSRKGTLSNWDRTTPLKLLDE